MAFTPEDYFRQKQEKEAAQRKFREEQEQKRQEARNVAIETQRRVIREKQAQPEANKEEIERRQALVSYLDTSETKPTPAQQSRQRSLERGFASIDPVLNEQLLETKQERTKKFVESEQLRQTFRKETMFIPRDRIITIKREENDVNGEAGQDNNNDSNLPGGGQLPKDKIDTWKDFVKAPIGLAKDYVVEPIKGVVTTFRQTQRKQIEARGLNISDSPKWVQRFVDVPDELTKEQKSLITLTPIMALPGLGKKAGKPLMKIAYGVALGSEALSDKPAYEKAGRITTLLVLPPLVKKLSAPKAQKAPSRVKLSDMTLQDKITRTGFKPKNIAEEIVIDFNPQGKVVAKLPPQKIIYDFRPKQKPLSPITSNLRKLSSITLQEKITKTGFKPKNIAEEIVIDFNPQGKVVAQRPPQKIVYDFRPKTEPLVKSSNMKRLSDMTLQDKITRTGFQGKNIPQEISIDYNWRGKLVAKLPSQRTKLFPMGKRASSQLLMPQEQVSVRFQRFKPKTKIKGTSLKTSYEPFLERTKSFIKPSFSLSLGDKSNIKNISRAGLRFESSTLLKPKQGLTPELILIPKQKITPGLAITPGIKSKLASDQDVVIKPIFDFGFKPVPTEPPVKPPKSPPGYPGFTPSIKCGKGIRKAGKGKKVKYGYTPSIVGLDLGIKAKRKSGLFTGFEFRGI